MSEDSNSSDSVELETGDTSFDCNDSFDAPPKPIIEDGKPRLEIIEQPQSRGFRFRYKCEGPSHGGLQGVHSERGNKKYPAVKVKNYTGPASVIVSIMTDEDPPRPHAHELIGKNCKNGVCRVEINTNDMTASFQNLGIQHVTKRKVVDILTERILSDSVTYLNNNINEPSFTNEQKKRAKQSAQEQAKNMQLNVVRLRFTALIQNSGDQSWVQLPPVYSNPIFDSKSPGTAALKICRMDKHAGCCEGNDEVFLLCDKVQKDDISVRFFECDEDGHDRWEAYGTFGPSDVHRQYAIVFKTPAYHDMTINLPINVKVQLKRVSDGAISEAKPFTYYPKQHDRDDVEKKRKKRLPGFGGGGTVGGKGNTDSGLTNGSSFIGFGGGLENLGSFGGQANDDGNQRFSFDLSTLIALNNLTTSYRRPVKKAKRSRYRRSRPIPDSDSTDSDSCEYSTGDSATFDLDPGLEGDLSSIDETDGSLPGQGTFAAQLMKHFNIGQPTKPTNHLDEELLTKSSSKKKKQEYLKNVTNQTKHQSAFIMPVKPAADIIPAAELTVAKDNVTGTISHEKYTNLKRKLKKLQHQLYTYEEVEQFEQSMLYEMCMNMARALQAYSVTGNHEFLLATHRRLVADTDSAGDTPIHLAVIHGQMAVLKTLLKLIAPLHDSTVINTQNNKAQSALHVAVLSRQREAVQLLLEHGIDPSLQDCHGDTVIHTAVREDDVECLQLLLQETHLHGMLPDLQALNYDGHSALHIATVKALLPHVKLLLKYSASIDVQEGKTGATPLHTAVQMNNVAIAKYLISEGKADVNAISYDYNTPLHIAVSNGSLELAAMLVAYEADPDAENIDFDPDLDDLKVTDEDKLDGGARWGGHIKRVGVTPRDLAFNDLQMLEVLDGKPYSRMCADLDLASITEDMTANCDPGYPASGFDLPGQTETGDLQKLTKKCRKQLARLLDPAQPGGDWVALSEWLNMGGLVSTLRVTPSPTQSLLHQLELEGGTCEMLEDCLLQMRRDDAVSILRSLRISINPPRSKHQENDNCDSGFGSLGSNHVSDMASLQCR